MASQQGSRRRDGLLGLMKRTGVPLTREHYLALAYMGEVPKELTPEEEAELPEEFQLHRHRSHHGSSGKKAGGR